MPAEIPVEHHPLQPFLPPGGRILMLGSFPPQQKRWAIDFYYPNFTNDMWRVIGAVFFDDPLHFVDTARRTYRKADIIAFLTERGIGIYDTASAVRRLMDNASDKYLDIVVPTDIRALLARMPMCRTVVTTGQKATDTACAILGAAQPSVGDYTTTPDGLRLYRMPSTSRAYPLSLQKKAEAYRRMFSEVLGNDALAAG